MEKLVRLGPVKIPINNQYKFEGYIIDAYFKLQLEGRQIFQDLKLRKVLYLKILTKSNAFVG